MDIRLEGICKRYDDVSVIEGLDLHIHDKELMVLVGPSGCGKSTALRMIAGLEEISDGSLYIGNQCVNDVHPKDRDVAMVFQSYALYPHMTVAENIGFGLKIRKVPKQEIVKRVQEIAAPLELTEYLDRKPKALSGGQRQRVALGRAIVRQPSVFLFDEPLSNLDAELRVSMRAEISQLQKRLQTTSVYVTHDQVEAMTMGNRICVMKKGEIMQVGGPLELYNTPANAFVARFIGAPPMNLATMRVADSGEYLAFHGHQLPLSQECLAAVGAYRGKEVIAGFRPDHIGDRSPESPLTVEIRGLVTLVEPLGHEVIVHFRLNDEAFVSKFSAHHIPEIGAEVVLNLDCNHLHLFDKKREIRI